MAPTTEEELREDKVVQLWNKEESNINRLSFLEVLSVRVGRETNSLTWGGLSLQDLSQTAWEKLPRDLKGRICFEEEHFKLLEKMIP